MTRLILTAGLAALFAFPAFAQQNCAPRDLVLKQLAERYGETRKAVGLGASGQVVEWFGSTETGTWTITVTLPSGMTCLVASGGDYEDLSEALPPNL